MPKEQTMALTRFTAAKKKTDKKREKKQLRYEAFADIDYTRR